LNSDDDDSFISVDTESEGDFGGGNNAHDDCGGLGVNIPNEGAQEVNDQYVVLTTSRAILRLYEV
jgi:hypothetical protein